MKTIIATILLALIATSAAADVDGCRAQVENGICILCKSVTYTTTFTVTASILSWAGATACDASVADFAETDGNCVSPYAVHINTASFATFTLFKASTSTFYVSAVAQLKAGACMGAKKGYRTTQTHTTTTGTVYSKTLTKCAITDCDACYTTSSSLENVAATTATVYRERCMKCGGSDMALKSDGSTCLKDKKPTTEVKNCAQYTEYNSDATKSAFAGKNYCTWCEKGHVLQSVSAGTGINIAVTAVCPEFKLSTCNVEGCSSCDIFSLTSTTATDGKTSASGMSISRNRKNRCTQCHHGWYMDYNTSLCHERAGIVAAAFAFFLVLFMN